VESQLSNVPDSLKKEAMKLGSALKDSISMLKEQFFQHKEAKGIQRNPNTLNGHLYKPFGYLESNRGAPNQTTQIAIDNAKRETDAMIKKVNELFDTAWKSYREKVEIIKYSLFKDFNRL
jgi:hypothetical protein